LETWNFYLKKSQKN